MKYWRKLIISCTAHRAGIQLVMIKVSTSGNYIVIGYKEENLQLCAFFLHYASGFMHSVALPIAIPPIFRRSHPNFVHLGDGIICYVAAVELTDKALFQIFFATFKVSKPNQKYIFWKENLWVDYDFISFSINFFYRIVDDPNFTEHPFYERIENRETFIITEVLASHVFTFDLNSDNPNMVVNCTGSYLL